MRIGMELASDNDGETFIGLSSGACDAVKVRSPRFTSLIQKYTYVRESASSP
jgi:hypothetical protein